MDQDKYELAKGLFFKNICNFNLFTSYEKKTWDSYNVPEKLVIEWVKEYLLGLEKGIYELIADKSILEIEKEKSILLNISIFLQKIYDYKINDFKHLIKILKIVDDEFKLGVCLNVLNGWDRLILNISLFLSNKEKEKNYLVYFSDHYYYDTGEEYFGLLPYLYKIKEYELFNELFDLLYKYLDDYKELNMEKHFDVYSVFIEYAKYMNMDYEKYLK